MSIVLGTTIVFSKEKMVRLTTMIAVYFHAVADPGFDLKGWG